VDISTYIGHFSFVIDTRVIAHFDENLAWVSSHLAFSYVLACLLLPIKNIALLRVPTLSCGALGGEGSGQALSG